MKERNLKTSVAKICDWLLFFILFDEEILWITKTEQSQTKYCFIRSFLLKLVFVFLREGKYIIII
jgi:hypothetical protein